jgi:L-ascorbate metabolism protein UlaG (beta-lactamase superfamily)
VRITLVGHSTVLLEDGGATLLLDPWFGGGNLAYRRIRPASLRASEVPRVDAVFLSHAHFDHLDRGYLGALPPETPVYVPRAAHLWLRLKLRRRFHPLARWGSARVGGLSVTAVPATHSGPTAGYVVQGSRTVYFAADTYFRPFMREIGERFRPEVALLPVTLHRVPVTMGPRGAARAATAVGARVVIPIHLGLEPRLPWLRPRRGAQGVRYALRDAGCETEVVELAEGESWQG